MFFVHTVNAASFPGNVSRDITFDPDVEYNIPNDITITSTGTLTIPAGTHVTVAPNVRIIVYGKLIVNGTAKKHVVISAGEEKGNLERIMSVPSESVPVAEIQTPETSSLEVAPLVPETTIVEASSPEIAPLEIKMGVAAVPDSQKYSGFLFMDNSSGEFSYTDINDASQGITVQEHVTVKASHMAFTNCLTGIVNNWGDVTLKDSTFVDTAFPGQISTYGTFTHTNTTFTGKGFKGWNYGGYVLQDTNLRLASKDGAYYMFGIGIAPRGTLTFGPGVTIFFQDGFTVPVDGTLALNGTELSPITVYGDNKCPLHMPLFDYHRDSVGTIRYTNFHDLCGGIKALNAILKINDSTFKNIDGTAVDMGNQTHVTMKNNDITKTKIAVRIEDGDIKDISQNYFYGNKVGVSLENMPNAVIKNNGWGSDLGPTFKINPGGDGDSIVVDKLVKNVVFKPWLGMKTIPDDTDDDGTTTTPPVVTPPTETTEHNPVIIVPGITGSTLTKEYGDKSELWLNLTKLALSPTDSYLDDLKLLQAGTPSTVRPVVVGDIIRSASTVDIFSGLINAFKGKGYVEGTDLFVFPYDWRLSNTTNQALLKDMVAAALKKSGKTKVDVIAHSMGGLLVKDYIAENPTAPIDHLFYIAVPHLGAPKTFKTLMYGDDMGFRYSLNPELQIPVLNEARSKLISQNMPAVYELLPSKKYIDILGPYIDDRSQASPLLNVEATEAVMAKDGRNEKMFPFAEKLHEKTDNLDVSKIRAYDFAGCGATKTVSGFTLTKEQSLTLTGFKLVPEHRLQYAAGDGVVPMNSANAGNGAINYYIPSGSHGTIPSLPAVQNAIIALLQGKTVTGISDKVSSCNLGGDIVEVHSPVSLDIYDEQGRHTGLTPDGIEYGIPNVQYDVIDNEKSAFLPSGPTYKIITKAESAGIADMYVSHTDGNDTVTHQAYYNAVPLVSDKSVGTMTLGPNTVDPLIAFDDTEDEVSDRTIAPSASLDEKGADDSVAPVTTAVFDGTAVTLVAADAGSGVLNTKYSTDNIVWNTYTKPFAAVVDSTVYFVSIDKAGNTEEIKQLKVVAPVVSSGGGGGGSVAPSTTTNTTSTTNTAAATVSTVSDKKEDIRDTDESTTEENDTSNDVQSTNESDDASVDSDEAKPFIMTKSYTTTPAADEGTEMSDPEFSVKSLASSTAAAGVVGKTGMIIIGILAIGVLLFLVFSKKSSK